MHAAGGGGAIGPDETGELVVAVAHGVVVPDSIVWDRCEKLAWAQSIACGSLVEDDIRDRALTRRFMGGIDVDFHLAAIRITQCEEELRLALEAAEA